MIVCYRLCEPWQGLPEGACITEEVHKAMYYLNKCLFEVVTEQDMKDMVKYEDEGFCVANGIEFLLFYNEKELDKFLNTKFDAAIID
jgi:hypothetical protein